MERADEILKEILDKALAKHGFLQTNDTDNIYSLIRDNDPGRITAKIILPEPGNESTFGIRGIQAIGNFRFKTPTPGVNEPDFYIFVFQYQTNNCIELIIISCTELIKRNRYRNCINVDNKGTEFIFYLMEGNLLFDGSELGGEGRYYYIDGRMAENTYRNYTEFLNNWKLLTTI